jgi:hypothetical protein
MDEAAELREAIHVAEELGFLDWEELLRVKEVCTDERMMNGLRKLMEVMNDGG